MRKSKLTFVLLILAFCLVLTACSTGDKQGEEVMVFAAASLTESFKELAHDFEELEDGKVQVVLNFAGSQALKTSIENGAKCDIFASASLDHMGKLKSLGYVGSYEVFATNRLTIIKSKGSGYSITSLDDLAAEGLKLAVGDVSVPVGKYWGEVLDLSLKDGSLTSSTKESIEKNIRTKELNVKDIVSKVVLGEVDAGIVYRTDVTAGISHKVEEVDVPVFGEVMASYPGAMLEVSKGRDAVKKFYDFIFSEKGREILKKHRFSAKV